MSSDLPFDIIDDEPDSPSSQSSCWKILIVDDDEDVHKATRYALSNISIFGRNLETLHASSADEALARIEGQDDIAVALVDVVMETEDAGLKLVSRLREAGLTETRIVLRTGYPGYAPELAVLSQYDIDDYRTKDELNRSRLIAVLTSSIRSYDHMHTLARSRKGLEMVIRSAREVFQRSNLQLFSEGILIQVAAMLRTTSSGFVCLEKMEDDILTERRIVSSTGRFAHLNGRRVRSHDMEVMKLLGYTSDSQEPLFTHGFMFMSFSSDERNPLHIVLETTRIPSSDDLDLLRLFATNIAIGYENVTLLETLEHKAHTDPIFDLPNLNACARLLKERLGSPNPGCLALVTIGSFQSFFAQYGPANTVSLIREIHNRLKQHSRNAETVIMADGSFGVLSSDKSQLTDAISSALLTPVRIGDLEVPLTPSSVLIELSERDDSAMSIIHDATLALLHICQTTPGRCEEYDDKLNNSLKRKRELAFALQRDAHSGHGFMVFLQAKNRLSDGQIIGAEALLRWRLNGEMVSPAEFIPIAEMTGQVQLLTEFVIREVGRWLSSQSDPKAVPVSINLSMADLNKPGFAQQITDLVASLNIRPEWLEFEVTEGVAMQDAKQAASQVEVLAAAGFRISLDDFGTGYSSLGQFDRLPIHTIKIDRSFVKQICDNPASRNLAAVIISMTQALNVDCVAEGIETEAQRQLLIRLGCETGQGFLFSKPVPMLVFGRDIPDDGHSVAQHY